MKTNLKKMTTMAILCALAYMAMLFIKIPVVAFLKYEPKDVIIAIGGFIYGPLPALCMSVVVSLVEMVTVSDTGPIGCLMNMLSTCSLVCTASFIYRKNRTLKGAVTGLTIGTLVVTAVMILWNYLVTPIHMGVPRDAVAEMLIPVFLPFNLFKGGLNSVITVLIYKLVVTALRKAKLLDEPKDEPQSSAKKWIFIGAGLIVATALLILIYDPS